MSIHRAAGGTTEPIYRQSGCNDDLDVDRSARGVPEADSMGWRRRAWEGPAGGPLSTPRDDTSTARVVTPSGGGAPEKESEATP